MPCNCGANKQTIAQAHARRTGAGQPLGFSPHAPHVIGEPNDVTRRVRVLRPTAGLTSGQAAHVTGDGVDALVESGHLLDITQTAQKKRLWKVNGFTYTDEAEARRVAAGLGTTAVEVA